MKFEPHKKSLKELYFEPTFQYVIPKYQRPYSWKKENWEEFWELIYNRESIFLGTVIYNVLDFSNNQTKEIIDGQQRYLTITILTAAFRDVYLELSVNHNESKKVFERANDIHETLIGKRNRFTDQYNNYLIVGASCKDYFENNIQKFPSEGIYGTNITEPKSNEEKLVYQSYIFFREKIKNSLSSLDYEELYKYIFKKIGDLFVISIEIDDYAFAFEIFESVNGQGVDLSVSDLIKNQIFKNIGANNLLRAEETWSEIIGNLEESNLSLNSQEFLRYYWASKYDYISDTKLYGAISREFGKETDEWNYLLKELHEYSYLILDIGQNLRDKWIQEFGKKDGTRIFNSIRVLKATKGKTWVLLVLTIFYNKEKFKNFDLNISKYLEKIQRFTFVYFSVLGYPGNWYWSMIHTNSRKVNSLNSKEELNSLFNEMFLGYGNKLKSVLKNEFMDSFQTNIQYSTNNISLIYYVLSEIELTLHQSTTSGWNPDMVNIEHFLPQEPKEWKVSKSDIKKTVNLIGNLLLIPEKLNGKLGNKNMTDKIKIIKNSNPDMYLLKELIDKIESNEWDFDKINSTNQDAILRRQEVMVERAYQIWITNLRKDLGC